MSDTAIAQKLAFKTDLQDRPPDGVAWVPTIRGFLSGDYYLIIKTYPDTSADVRRGRVFSHFLAIQKSNLSKIHSIYELINYFPKILDKSVEIKDIIYKPLINKLPIEDVYKLRFSKVVHGIGSLPQYNNVIVWSGQNYYEEIVSKIWEILTTEEKETFNFGLYFDPRQIPLDSINLIVTTESTLNNFENYNYCVVRSNDVYTPTNIYEAYLLNDASAVSRVNAFVTDIGIKNLQRKDIPTIAKGIPTYENVDTIDDFKKLNTLSYIIAEYSPHANEGSQTKRKLLRRLISCMPTISASEFLSLKTFKLDSIENSERDLTIAAKKWIATNLFSIQKNKKDDFSEIVTQAFNKTTNSNWLLATTKSEISTFLARLDQNRTELILLWLRKSKELLEKIYSKIDSSKKAEKHFIDKMNATIVSELDEQLINLALRKSWFSLYATLLKLQLPIESAVAKYLLHDNDNNNSEPIEILIKGEKPNTIVSLSITNADNRLLSVASKECIKQVSLLDGRDISEGTWQLLWLSVIQKKGIEKSNSEPQQKITDLLDLVLEGKDVHFNLLKAISESSYASLLHYNSRQTIWDRLPNTILPGFLSKTIQSLQRLNADLSSDTYSDINSQLNVHGLIQVLFKDMPIQTCLWIANSLSNFRESHLVELVTNRFREFENGDCNNLAIIINKNKFETLYNLINSNISYKNSKFKSTVSMTRDTFYKPMWNPLSILFPELPKPSRPRQSEMYNNKIKILFLSASPDDENRLRVDVELRKIEEGFEAARLRDRFDLIKKVAVKYDTLAKTILDNDPSIIHFSGHGFKDGIVLENEKGKTEVLSKDALEKLFSLFKDKVQCIVLNACYSEKQAKAISKHGIYVVGMNNSISDDAAINFSIGFYQSIGSGKDIEFSFQYAMAQLLAKNASEKNTPKLLLNGKKVS